MRNNSNSSEVIDDPNGNTCVTLVKYKKETRESSYAHFQKILRKEQEKKVEKFVTVSHTIDEFFYVIDVMNSVYKKFG